MSGSPILQNGKLVGAITHVLIGDPSKGYGITMENMLRAAGEWEQAAAVTNGAVSRRKQACHSEQKWPLCGHFCVGIRLFMGKTDCHGPFRGLAMTGQDVLRQPRSSPQTKPRLSLRPQPPLWYPNRCISEAGLI
jgi:hypothetical protein